MDELLEHVVGLREVFDPEEIFEDLDPWSTMSARLSEIIG